MDIETAAQNAARTVFPGITSRVVSFIALKPYGGKPNTLIYKSHTETTRTFDNL